MPTATRSEFFDLVRVIDAERQSTDAIFSESGRRLGRRNSPAYVAQLTEAAKFLADVIDGRIHTDRLQEALSTSDFPVLMGDIFDRQMLGRYQEIAATWPNYARRGTVRDFRTVRRVAVDGLEGAYYPSYTKPELTEPQQEDGLTETGYTYSVNVYEKRAGLNWRMLVNDDLDAFRSIPDRLARGARRTEDRFATTLFVDANGPHASLYTVGNKNIVNATNAGSGFTAVNPPLTIAALQQAFAVLANQKDANGEPIMIEAVELVVPPALQVTAMNILNATEIWGTTSAGDPFGGTSAQQVHVINWMRNAVHLNVNPYIPIVASSANGNTSWFLFANPSVGRPALEVGFLRGFEQPSLWQKAPNMQRLGGAADPTMGDFDTGEIVYKGMHVIGGTRLDPKATVASNGSGS